METLKDAYRDTFRIGAAFSSEEKVAALREVGPEHFNAWTPENAMKCGPMRPERGEFRFEAADRYLELARSFGMVPHGHTLVWWQQCPEWLFVDSDGAEIGGERLLHRMEEHIATVLDHFRGVVPSWDVVNEALSDGPGGKPLFDPQRDRWARQLGEDYVCRAFRCAADADPELVLYYNDYWTGGADRALNLAKVDRGCRLVEELRDGGARVDGVGVQAHWELHSLRIDEVERLLERFAELEVLISISELDLGVLGTWGGERTYYPDGLPEEVERRQARAYARLFGLFRRYASVIERVTFWGVSDRGTWKSRVQNGQDYPLLFDTENRPKEALYAVLDPDGYLAEHPEP